MEETKAVSVACQTQSERPIIIEKISIKHITIQISAIPLKEEFEEEKKALLAYIEEHIKHGPAQKSAAWYAIKNVTIGGSEVATVLGMNQYKTPAALVGEKSIPNFNNFRGNIATRWGNVFEHITKKWSELVLNMPEPILEFGSVEGVIERQRYSPDGVGLVLLKDSTGKITWFKVLFEFKAPFLKIPDGNVPEHYYPQVQTGLLTFPILDISIFVNNCYRKCKLKDLGFSPDYDTNFHKDQKYLEKANDSFETLACGMIFFYQKLEDYQRYTNDDLDDESSDSDFDILESVDEVFKYNAKFKKFNPQKLEIIADPDPQKKAIDFGTSDDKTLNALFELLEEGDVMCEYSSLILNNDAIRKIPLIDFHSCILPPRAIEKPRTTLVKEFNNFLDVCDQKKNKIIGYLPWKLMRSDMIVQHLEDGWREKIEPKIKDILNKIDIIMAEPTEDDKYKKYYEFFPQKQSKSSFDMSKMKNLFDDLD